MIQHIKTRPPGENPNIVKTSPLAQLALLFGGLLVLGAVLTLILGAVISVAAVYMPTGLERRIGGFFAERISKQVMEEETRHLTPIFNQLVEALDKKERRFDFKMFVIREKAVNAVALPGGVVVVFSGLLDKVTDDEERAFVLAHELGHFIHRDHVKGMGRRLALTAVGVFFSAVSETAGRFLMAQADLLDRKFSRDQEQAADLFALKLIYKTRHQTLPALKFMERLDEMNRHGKLAHYFATHPHPKDRLAFLKARIPSLESQ